MSRASDTRRIRKRARAWRARRVELLAPVTVAAASQYLRELAAPRLWIGERPALTGDELRHEVEENLRHRRGQLLRALDRRHREGPHMRNYWRGQVIDWLAVQRAEPLLRSALEIVTRELRLEAGQ